MIKLFFLILFILAFNNLDAQISDAERRGSNNLEREWWDVIHMDLSLDIDITNRSFRGSNTILFKIIEPLSDHELQIDLIKPLAIDSILYRDKLLKYRREGNHYFIQIDKQLASEQVITIFYSGFPKTSDQPPYDGGVKWALDSLNRPFYSVSCQTTGASVWYPCKDYYEDEPDMGINMSITIPDSLVAVSNGRLIGTDKSGSKKRFDWEVKSPINLYGLSFYIGNYIEIQRKYQGRAGTLDMNYWVLDYNTSKVESHLIPETLQTLNTLEKWYGPYPFYDDSYKIVEAPYIGMEHQSAIAYGNNFQKGRFGFNLKNELHKATDRLVVHETAHEWFGNNITMADMADRWVQEGFAAYAEELVIEELFGREKGREFFISRRQDYIKNEQPLISSYGVFKDAGPDMYFKGWAIIHMLREIMNDDVKFMGMLNEMNQKFSHQTLWSKDLEDFINNYFSMDLGPFFDQYLRNASLPILEIEQKKNRWRYHWTKCPDDFYLPVKVIAGKALTLEAGTRWKKVKVDDQMTFDMLTADPNYLFNIHKINE